MEYRRLLAIGDIHGNYERLMSVYRKSQFDPEQDFLILLGDYVDRGPECGRCLRWAMEMSRLPNVVALRGNHEQMMLCYYELGCPTYDIWLPNGGYMTKRDMDAWEAEDNTAKKRVLDFIWQRPLYYRLVIDEQEYIFCHAGLKPGLPLEKQTDEHLLWIREEFYNNYDGTAKVIVGHTPVEFLQKGRRTPLKLANNITIIDTGSFLPEGRITCMNVLEETYWQSDD